MAELEVIKHTKKALKSFSQKDKDFWHKLKDFFLEIFIIVFAVSLSIWLHGWSEKKHKQEEVKEFLIDLKADLLIDRKKIIENKKNINFKYYKDLKIADSLIFSPSKNNVDSLNKQTIVRIVINRNTNSGNYEGFKSSGNISYILNKPLKSKILEYYEQESKNVLENERIYNNQMEKVLDNGLKNTKSDYFSVNKTLLGIYKKIVNDDYDQMLKKNDILVKDINKEINK